MSEKRCTDERGLFCRQRLPFDKCGHWENCPMGFDLPKETPNENTRIAQALERIAAELERQGRNPANL